jgi:hypothetical protein
MRWIGLVLVCLASFGCTHKRLAELFVETLCTTYPATCEELTEGE